MILNLIYLCPWVSNVHHHVTIVTNVIKDFMLEERFRITIRYFLTRAIDIQRVFNSYGNATATYGPCPFQPFQTQEENRA